MLTKRVLAPKKIIPAQLEYTLTLDDNVTIIIYNDEYNHWEWFEEYLLGYGMEYQFPHDTLKEAIDDALLELKTLADETDSFFSDENGYTQDDRDYAKTLIPVIEIFLKSTDYLKLKN